MIWADNVNAVLQDHICPYLPYYIAYPGIQKVLLELDNCSTLVSFANSSKSGAFIRHTYIKARNLVFNNNQVTSQSPSGCLKPTNDN